MNGSPQDLKPRTKAFALRVIRLYSKLPKGDTVALWSLDNSDDRVGGTA
jgi:hypothetical protein